MEKKSIRKAAFIDLIITITGFLLLLTSFVVFGNNVLSPYRAGNYQEEQLSFTKDQIENIDIALASKNIVIKEGMDENGSLNYIYFNDDKITSEIKGNTLVMKEEEKWRFFIVDISFFMNFLTQSGTDKVNVELTLPKDIQLSSIKLATASGDSSIENINTNDLNIDIASGNIKLNGLKTTNIILSSASGDKVLSNINTDLLKINSVSGNVTKNNIKAKTIKFNSASGDLVCDTLSFDALDIDMVSGNTKLFNIEGTEKDYQISSDMISGNLSIDNKKIGGFSKDSNNTNTTKSIKIRSTSGDTSLFFTKTTP